MTTHPSPARRPWARLLVVGALVAALAVTVSLATGPAPIADAATGSLESVSPARLLDTRTGANITTVDGQFRGGGRVGAGGEVQLVVAGRGGVPAGVSAVLVNVTVIAPSAAGYVTVYECGTSRPTASNVNYTAGQIVPNAVLAAVSADGRICLYTLAETHLAVDVNGFVPAGGSPVPVAPARLLETRSGPGDVTVDGQSQGIGRVGADSVTAVAVRGRGGVPADASAVLVNLTAVNPSGNGFLTAFPCDEGRPTASSVNYVAGQVAPNAVLAKIGADGRVCIYSLAATHLVMDVNGVVPPGGTPTPLTPARLLETRDGPNATTVDGDFVGFGRVPADSGGRVTVAGRGGVPYDATAVLLNVTAVNPSAAGYLTVFSCDDGLPDASNVNYGPGEVVPNAVLARIDSQGDICIYTLAETHILADVVGYVGPTASSPTGGYATFARWDPCIPIVYAVDPTNASPSQLGELTAAVAEVELHTGLDFQFGGNYTATYVPDGFGNVEPTIPPWADAGFTFPDDDIIPDFGAGTLGITSTLYLPSSSPSTSEIFEGVTYVDPTPGGQVGASLEATLLHEIGHLVGLDHVTDPEQLMYPYDTGRQTFNTGDIEGLRQVGIEQGCLSGTRDAAAAALDQPAAAPALDQAADDGAPAAQSPAPAPGDLVRIVHDGYLPAG